LEETVDLQTERTHDHLLYFAGPFIDRGDLDIALYLLDVILPCVAVAPQGLNRGVGALVGYFGGVKLRQRSFHLEVGVAGIQPSCDLLYVGSSGFELSHEWQDQLVAIALFLDESRPKLDPLFRVVDRLL